MFLVMGVIFFLSHQSGNSLYLPPIPGMDKFCHMSIYGMLAMTVLWALGRGKQVSLLKVALETFFFCLLYGVSDEFHQSFIPQRSVSGLDLLADLAGAMLVCAVWMNSQRFRDYLESCYRILARRLKEVYIKKYIQE
jgi:uncharacterized protein YfiM (DUF2279 family)